MISVNEKVKVGMSDIPKWVLWKGRIYKITQIGLHHTYKEGLTLHHVFSVISKDIFMKIDLDTKNLLWTLKEIENAI